MIANQITAANVCKGFHLKNNNTCYIKLWVPNNHLWTSIKPSSTQTFWPIRQDKEIDEKLSFQA